MKPKYGLIGRVNTPNIPVMEGGRFEFLLDVPCGDNNTAIAKAERIFWKKFFRLEPRQSILAYLHKDGTQIHNFPEIAKVR